MHQRCRSHLKLMTAALLQVLLLLASIINASYARELRIKKYELLELDSQRRFPVFSNYRKQVPVCHNCRSANRLSATLTHNLDANKKLDAPHQVLLPATDAAQTLSRLNHASAAGTHTAAKKLEGPPPPAGRTEDTSLLDETRVKSQNDDLNNVPICFNCTSLDGVAPHIQLPILRSQLLKQWRHGSEEAQAGGKR